MGGATERSYYPALKRFLEDLVPGITATPETKRIECGVPDFRISRASSHGSLTIGYVEAKDLEKPLKKIEKDAFRSAPSTVEGGQLKRYLRIDNLLLTNFIDFCWYVDGERRAAASLGALAPDGKLTPESGRQDAVLEILESFLNHKPQDVSTPKDLALRMARLTHTVRDIVLTAFETDKASVMLRDLRGAFAKTLIPDLEKTEKTPEFADMFAQTLAYGLFAARCNHQGKGRFRRLGAAREIPKTNPFLRRLFEIITGTDLDDEPSAGFVDDLAQLLADCDMAAILEHFGKRTRKEDPVVHFYETFLAAYDPKIREMRGVYYTPEPVVSYIVRSVDHLLKTRFNCPGGLADTQTIEYERIEEDGKQQRRVKKKAPRVLVLDPACGTGTFLYAVVDHIRDEFKRRNDAGMWSGFVKDQLLPRLFGFELLMAPYAVAHFKLGMQLAGQDFRAAQREKWAYDFSGDERLGIYLTNTLEEAERRAETLFGPLRIISDEAHAAAEVKRDKPVLVVMGNPPYSGHSANRSWEMKDGKRVRTLIGNLLQDYYQVDGQPLGERNPKWLQDDYVKFIRFGQRRIDQTGEGILAFITNHGYLDNPTFRGMRQQLMNAFTDIYILNLHGNTKKKEKCPDGSKDENVFDIQQGVAIGIFVKEPGKTEPAKVHYADLWGLRKDKYHSLLAQETADTDWEELTPQSPSYLFVPQENDLKAEYERGWRVTEIMPVNSVGIVTARDNLTIHWTEDDVWRVVRDFAALPEGEAKAKYQLPKDARDWKVALAQKDLRDSGPKKSRISSIAYRPFDTRFTYYTGRSRGFICMPRPEVMRHMMAGENIGLVVPRRVETVGPWQHLGVSRASVEHVMISLKTIDSLFPLYLYPNEDKEGELFSDGQERHPNISPKFIAELSKHLCLTFISDGPGDLKKTFGPEDVFNYIYAVFHSPTYRRRYTEFLKIDFPRVPLTSNVGLFRTLCQKGEQLVALHLLESPALQNPAVSYPVRGDNLVEKFHPKYMAPGEAEPGTGKPLKEGRVYISGDKPGTDKKGQYFEGVPPEVWEFQVGGYQVCQKWLKDRRGCNLTYNDTETYKKIVVALKETIRLMAEIDEAIPAWPLE